MGVFRKTDCLKILMYIWNFIFLSKLSYKKDLIQQLDLINLFFLNPYLFVPRIS